MPLKHNTGTIQMMTETDSNTMILTTLLQQGVTQVGIRLGPIAVMSLMEVLMEKIIRFPI